MVYTQQIINDLNLEVVTYQQFIDKYFPGLSKPALNAAKKNDKIDVIKYGNQNMIILTEKSLNYSPNNSCKRIIKNVTTEK